MKGVSERTAGARTDCAPVIHHIDFAVTDFDRSRAFYLEALAPLGIGILMDIERDNGRRLVGFGLPPDPTFWIRTGSEMGGRLHIAFSADTRSAVDAFHEAALHAGGTDNGGPGLRPRYAEHYYAAFVLDPDGHNIEAVCRRPA
jgi:catechol 2,3-dioxygenase-like lactoylglutathione lyase family enzyme